MKTYTIETAKPKTMKIIEIKFEGVIRPRYSVIKNEIDVMD